MRQFMYVVVFTGAFGLAVGFQNCSNVKFGQDTSSSQTGAGMKAPLCRPVTANEVQPRLKWDWFTNLAASPAPRFEAFNQVMAAPMVGDLNGDGRPEVVFTTFSTNPKDMAADVVLPVNYGANGVLRVVDGASGLTKFSIGSLDLAPMSASSPLLMDIDGDGRMEIFYFHYTGNYVVALNADGGLRWKFAVPKNGGYSAVGMSAGAVDARGIGSVVAGGYVITESATRQPSLKFTLGAVTAFGYNSLSLPLDPAHPDQFHVVNYNGIFRFDGSTVALFATPNLYLAAADLYPDVPGVEVIATGQNMILIYNGLTGALIKKVDLQLYNDLKCPGGTIGGGPATIGNFDGAGQPQIAIATGRYLTIFDRFGAPLYNSETSDCSSLSTGITSFDMNGDGKPEILYGDEQYVRIFEVNGGVLRVATQIVNPSGTLNEYPVIADLTDGGASNLLVVSNNYAASSLYGSNIPAADRAAALSITGVRAFESSAEQAWMPSRPVWNQYSYHPDLVTNTGRVIQAPAWDASYFRRNNQGTRVDMVCTQPGT